MTNIELPNETLSFIQDNPEEWDQTVWCGTACCFAGLALDLAGIHIREDWEEVAVTDMPEHLREAAPGRAGYDEAGNASIGVGFAAMLVLGLDDETRHNLFAANNGLRDLERIVAELCDKAVEAGAR
jgi:hypothetical protein